MTSPVMNVMSSAAMLRTFPASTEAAPSIAVFSSDSSAATTAGSSGSNVARA